MSERAWGEGEQSIYDALIRRLGAPIGDRGRGQGAYREASRRLTQAGVRADDLAIVLSEYAAAALQQTGPMSLAAWASGSGEAKDARWLVLSRWASTCATCGGEIERGRLCWYRRNGERGYVVCERCEEVPYGGERASAAIKRGLAKEAENGDVDDLVRRLLDLTPKELRAQVEDDLPLTLWASEA